MWMPPSTFNDAFRAIVPSNYQDSRVVYIIIPKFRGNSGIYLYGFWISQDISYGINGMHPHICQGPAPGQLLFGKPSGRAPIFMYSVALGLKYSSYCSRGYGILYITGIGIETPHMTNHHQLVMLGCYLSYLFAFFTAHSHGFFKKNILTILQELYGIGSVKLIGRAYNYCIQIISFYKRRDVVQRLFNIVFKDKFLGII